MKKLNFLFLAIIALAFTFTSCNNEGNDHAAPVITLNQSDMTIDAGDDVIFTGTITTTGKLKEVKFFVDGVQSGDAITNFDNDTLYNINVPFADIQTTFEFKVRATDELDQESEEVVTVTVSEAPAMSEYTGVALSYTSTSLADNCMFNAATGASLDANGIAADMDFAFVWQNTYEYSIVSPDAQWLVDLWAANAVSYSTADKNTTVFAEYTAKAYADITADDLNAISIGTSHTVAGGGNGYQNLTNGSLIAFITEDGYKGVLRINIVTKVTVACSVDVKVVAPAAVK